MKSVTIDYKALYEAEQKAKEEAVHRAEKERREKEEAVHRAEQERTQKEQFQRDLYSTTREFLSRPLLPFVSDERPSVPSTTSMRILSHVPWVIRQWQNFEGYADSFLSRFGDNRIRRETEGNVAHRYSEAGVSANYYQLFVLMVLMFSNMGMIREGELTTFGMSKPQGGFPDCVIQVFNSIIVFGELKNPRVDIRSITPPFEQELKGDNPFQRTVIQLYNYLISNNGAIYGFISNWTDWMFLRRLRGPNGEEILEMTRFFSFEEVRKHLAAFLYLAMRHSSRLGKLSKANLPLDYSPGGGRDNLDPDDGDDEDPSHRGEPLRSPYYEFKLPRGHSRTRNSREEAREGFFSLVTQISGVSFTTTTAFLGIDNLCVNEIDKSELLLHTSKSATFRYRSDNHDLVWRLVDVHGLPRNNKDFALPELQVMITTEIETYMHLKEYQGKLIPRFKYFGHDFGSFWVFVTSYEGVALSKLADEQSGLSQAIKNKTKESLLELHRLGVLHGDVKLGNILLRNGQDIVWIDFEFAQIGPVSSEKAQNEFSILEKDLAQVRTLPDHPSEPTPGQMPESVPEPVPAPDSHAVQTPKSESSHSSVEKSKSNKKMKRTKVCCTVL